MSQLQSFVESKSRFDAVPADFGQPEDRDLTRRLVTFLLTNGLLQGARLALRVQSGHVELRGTVGSFRHRQRLEAFVRRVAGVHQVINQTVVGTPFVGPTVDYAAGNAWAVSQRD